MDDTVFEEAPYVIPHALHMSFSSLFLDAPARQALTLSQTNGVHAVDLCAYLLTMLAPSAQFPGQDVDLIGGLPNGVIAGFHANNDTHNMVWNLKNTGTLGNQFTLANDAPSSDGAYVGVVGEIAAGVPLYGSSTPLTWTAVGTCTAGQYWILAPSSASSSSPSGLIWSLANSNDDTPIMLEVISYAGPHSLEARQQVSQAFSLVQFNH
ncbi:hypothetical protein V8E55_002987 [Tylopilus felleus]